jgi:hypothetical protein
LGNIAILSTKILHGERPSLDDLPPEVPESIRQALSQCWDTDRNKRLTATDLYIIIQQAANTMGSGNFDIFLSHAWANKCVVKHIFVRLRSLGYVVWYDQVNMGLQLRQSMRDGIARSKVFVAGINALYQSRANCKFEFLEAANTGKPMLAIVLEDIGDLWGQPNKPWKLSQELKDAFAFKTTMYHDISKIASDPIWEECDDKNEDPPSDKLEELNKSLETFVSLLVKGNFLPSLPPQVN